MKPHTQTKSELNQALSPKWYLPVLFLGIVVALFLRFYKLGQVPVSLYIDEVAIGIDARSIAETGKDMHGLSPWTAIIPSYGDYKMPVYIWATAASIKVFGASAWSIRLPSALAGVFSVILLSQIVLLVFAQDEHRWKYSVAAAWLSAILPWSLVFSRTGFEGHLAQCLVLASLWFVLLARKRVWLLFIAALIGGFAVYAYYSVRFIFPPLFVLTLWCTYTHWNWKKLSIGLLALLVWGLTFVPMAQSKLFAQTNTFRLSAKNILNDDTRQQRVMDMRQRTGNSVLSKLLFTQKSFLLQDFLHNYATFFGVNYLFLKGDPNLRHGTGYSGVLLPAMLPIFVLGLWKLGRIHKKVLIWLLGWFAVSCIPAAIPQEIPHALRSINGLGALVIVIAVGVITAWQWSSAQRIKRVVFGVYCLTLAANFIWFESDYFGGYAKRSARAWSDGNTQFAETVWKYADSVGQVWASGDEKIYLWILWQSKLPSTELQQSPEQNYQKLSLGNIRFDRNMYYIGQFSKLQENILLVDQRSVLQESNQETTIIQGKFAESPYGYLLRK